MGKTSYQKANQYDEARRLYLTTPEGIKDSELEDILNVSNSTVQRYRRMLGCVETAQNSYRYTLMPSDDDIEYAKAILRRVGLRLEHDPEFLDSEGLALRLQKEMEEGF